MRTTHRSVRLLPVLCLTLACTAVPSEEDLRSMYDAHDYFALRDRLAGAGTGGSLQIRFYRAALKHAFNEPAESSRLLGDLLTAGDLEPDLALEAWRLERDNALRLHDYRTALAAAREVIARVDADETADARNLVRLLEALADVPAQRVVERGPSVLSLERAETGLRIPLAVGGIRRSYLFDTGANYSVLMRSEAESLGLRVRAAGVEVGNSVGGKIVADLAVAGRLTIGNLELSNVVFLVFDDALLSFPDAGVRLAGIIGFPVMEAMGEIRFRGDLLEIPGSVPEREVQNLALEQLEPLLQVGFGDDTLVCRFDTGAGRTEFYEPFFRRYGDYVTTTGRRETARTAGVGEGREVAAWVLPEVTIRIADAEVRLSEPDVFTEPLNDDPEENYLDCNLGQDALAGFEEHVINFRSMSFLLLPKPSPGA